MVKTKVEQCSSVSQTYFALSFVSYRQLALAMVRLH